MPSCHVAIAAAVRIEPLLLEGDEGGTEHQQRHADAGRRVEAERHRGDVVAAGLRAPAAAPSRV